MFTLQSEIGPGDIEPLYNHVHHAHALRFLERGRLEFLKKVGLPNEALIAQGLFLVITDISVVYKRELFPGPITVTCEAGTIVDKRIILPQKILNQKGKVAVEATVASAFLSAETKRAIVPPEFFQERFLGAHP